MKLLAEGPASSALNGMDKLSGHGDSEDRGDLRKTDSLFEAFLPKFAEADTDERLATVCLQAETALLRYRGHYKAEMELPTDDKTAMERVIQVFEGISPIEVARRFAGRVSPGWVELARRRHRRHPDTGHRLEGWQGWDDERREKEIRKAYDQGRSQREAALEFNAPRTTMQRMWDQVLRTA